LIVTSKTLKGFLASGAQLLSRHLSCGQLHLTLVPWLVKAGSRDGLCLCSIRIYQIISHGGILALDLGTHRLSFFSPAENRSLLVFEFSV